jgi:hypothetical protein
MQAIERRENGMQVAKLHRYVSRSGPIAAGLNTMQALEAAENEGWPILPPVVARSDIHGFRCYGRLWHEARRLRA